GVEVDPPPGGRLREGRLSLGAGCERGGPEGGVEVRAGGAGADDGDADRHGRDGSRGDSGEGDPTRRARTARRALRLDTPPQARGCGDLVGGAPCERDRSFPLGESTGERRRATNSRLERGPAFRRKRPVRERRKLCHVVRVDLLPVTTLHRHTSTNGT